MPTLFNDIDKKFWFYQPNLTRWRHPFRSPRSSLKINQEISQSHYDIVRINKRTNDATDEISAIRSNVFTGWNFDNNVNHSDLEASTPSELPADFMGLSEMASRIEKLKYRVRSLEGM